MTLVLYLFDIDGTLVLSGGAGARALDRAFHQRWGFTGAMATIKPGGMTDPAILEQVFSAQLGRLPTAAELDEMIEIYLPLLEAEIGDAPGFRVTPSAVEALDYLSGRGSAIILGLATGNVREAARIKLERGGLWPRFVLGGFGCDHRERPRLVERAIQRACVHAGVHALDPAQVVVVGDTPLDVHAARACGVRAVAVATGTATRADLVACAPDVVLDTLAELPAWHAAQF